MLETISSGPTTGSAQPPVHAVIGLAASAGGVEALSTVIGGLPANLPAAVLVVLHVAPVGPSVLPAILSRNARLPAVHPKHGEPLRAAHVYVAPPDRQMLVADNHLEVVLGPRENGNRPAADPMLRSMASAFGSHCAGVVLSGSLDDGAAGLAAVAAAGGLTVVQDPEEAMFTGMPRSALDVVRPDHVVPLAEIAGLITRFAETPETTTPSGSSMARESDLGKVLSEFTCPDCGGSLWLANDEPLQFRCRVGHVYSEQALEVGKQDALEAALWAAIVALEERADLARRILHRTTEGALRARLQRRYQDQIEQSRRGAATLRRLVAELVAAPEQRATEDQGESNGER